MSKKYDVNKPHPLCGDPTFAWEKLAVKQVVNVLNARDSVTSDNSVRFVDASKVEKVAEDGWLRFVCLSDTHSRLLQTQFEIPRGDVLLHAGDFSMTGRPKEIQQFQDWLDVQEFEHKIVIAGNHDLTLDIDLSETKKEGELGNQYYSHHAKRFHGNVNYDALEIKKEFVKHCTYLEDAAVEIQGLKIYGSPHSPWFCDWAFGPERGEQILEQWKKIPDDVDLLMTHGPPVGHGDLCQSQQRAGCVDLLMQIQHRIKPKVHVFGHIHEGAGVTSDGQTAFVNASTCNFNYRPLNPPIVFDMKIPIDNNSNDKNEEKDIDDNN